MVKLYKIIFFFVGLIAMNVNVQAQLGGYSPYIAQSNAGNDLTGSNTYLASISQNKSDWAGISAQYLLRDATDFTNYPNPAVTHTTIAYTLTARAKVTLRVIDLAGKQLTVLIRQEQAAGKQEYYWELSKNSVTSGMYILLLHVDNKIYSRKIIVQ